MLKNDLEIARLKYFLADYLLERRVDIRRRFRCLAPGHEDRNPSMGYNADGQYVHCFSCGASYDIYDLVGMEYGLESFSEQIAKVRELYDGADEVPAAMLSYQMDNSDASSQIDLGVQLAALQQGCTGNLEYFLSRGISEEACHRYGLFMNGGRAYFPIWEQGVCTGWCGRATSDQIEPRYKNSPGPMGLWNGDILQKSGSVPVFVTEGIIDAICLEQMGYRAVALCGSQNTKKFLQRVVGRDIDRSGYVLCGDADAAGASMNRALKEALEQRGFPVSILALNKEGDDVAAHYLRDRKGLERVIGESVQALEVPFVDSMASHMDVFFQKYVTGTGVRPVPTGFPLLDKLLDGGIYPALYIIGAISSVGKTSFALQLVDQISAGQKDVLFFSLEQGRDELLAKSLSRLSAEKNLRQGMTARAFLRGDVVHSEQGKKYFSQLQQQYLAGARHLFVWEGDGGVGTAEIEGAMQSYLDATGRTPIVVVDYLQILKPSDGRATDKQNTDRAVVALKRLSRDYDTPVIAVSSFNRENYRLAVSMESFKESGAVEYSADVLMGLQLEGAGTKSYDVNKEKMRNPRHVELVLLKNRNGVPHGKIKYDYFAKYNLFQEVSRKKEDFQ